MTFLIQFIRLSQMKSFTLFKSKSLWLIFVGLFLPEAFFDLPAQASNEVFRLSDGLEVILKENHNLPVISAVVVIRAGSIYENQDNMGASHLLEHLLFDGTKKRSRFELEEGIKDKGGYINAHTDKEFTEFILLMPKEQFEFGFDILADMLFNSNFPKPELAKERKVVAEEIKKDLSSLDYQVETFFDSLVFANTPYTQPVLGSEESINKISRKEIEEYYKTYYQPNRMQVLVMGDFNSEKMKNVVEKYFGFASALRPAYEPLLSLNFPKKSEVKYKTFSTPNTDLKIAFPAPRFDEPDFYPIRILVEILNSQETSPLYQPLKGGKDPLTIDFSANLDFKKEYSLLNFNLTTDSEKKVNIILETLNQSLKKLSQKNFTAEEIKRVLLPLKTEEYLLQERPHYYWMSKAPFLVNFGYNFWQKDLGELEKVTPQQINNAALKYFSNPVSMAAVVSSAPAPAEVEKNEGLKNNPGLPQYKKEILPNGLTVIVKRNFDSQVLAINLLSKSRLAMEPQGKSGISDFLNRLLLKGTATRSALQIQEELQAQGAQIKLTDDPYIPYDDIYNTPNFSFVRWETIDPYAPQAFRLLGDLIKNSIFPQSEMEKVRSEILDVIKREEKSPSKTARNLIYQSMFENHPYWSPLWGTEQSIKSIARKDLIDFHQKYFSADNLILTVVSGLEPETLLVLIKKNLSDLKNSRSALKKLPATAVTEAKTAQKKIGSPQAYLYVGTIFSSYQQEDKLKLDLANLILANRLALDLRERQGLAYSVSSQVNFDPNLAWFLAYLGTAPQNLEKAKEEFLKKIKGLNEKISFEELEKAKNSALGNLLLSRLSSINQAFYMGVNEFLGLGYDFDQAYPEKLKQITLEEVQKVAGEYWGNHQYCISLVQ